MLTSDPNRVRAEFKVCWFVEVPAWSFKRLAKLNLEKGEPRREKSIKNRFNGTPMCSSKTNWQLTKSP